MADRTDLRDLKARLMEAELKRVEAEVFQLELENRKIAAKGAQHGAYQYVGAVEEGAVHILIGELSSWSRANPEAPLTLFLNSQGGGAFDGFALFDFLQELRRKGHHVTIKGIGLVASMGSILLQAADERVMSPRAWMLIHEVQGVSAGSFSKMEDDIKFNKRLQNMALDIYTDRCNWTRARIVKNWTRKDFWLSAEEALEAGFCDRIEG